MKFFVSGMFLPESLSEKKLYFEIHILCLTKTGSMLQPETKVFLTQTVYRMLTEKGK